MSNERVHTHGLETTWLELYHAGLSAPDLPAQAVVVMDDPPPESTIDEARRSAALLKARGLHSALQDYQQHGDASALLATLRRKRPI